MNILLDARPALGGMARYVDALLTQLERVLPPGSVRAYGRAGRRGAGRAGQILPPAAQGLARRLAGLPWRILDDQALLPLRAARWRANLFHAAFGVIPAGLRIPAVVTFYDSWALTHPQERPPGPRALYERRALRAALRRAAQVIAISRAMARELTASLGLDPSRVTTIYPVLAEPPPPDARTPERLGLQLPFWLSVGTLEPRKNQCALIAAQRAAWRQTGMPLVLAGARGWRDEPIVAAAAAAGPAVRLTGYVSDAELAWLYGQASALVQFSRYEGFDYPVAEALRAGLPLILSDIEAHRELAGEAAVYVPPDAPETLTKALVRVLERSEAERARQASRARERFDDIRGLGAVERYLDCYRRVCGSAPPP